MKRKLYLFFHICTIGRWQEIVQKLYSKILRFGLIDRIDHLQLSVLGDPEKVLKIINSKKAEIIYSSDNLNEYERPCLRGILQLVEKEYCDVIYIHSKGVSQSHCRAKIESWVNLLSYFLLERWGATLDCLALFNPCAASSLCTHVSSSDKRISIAANHSGHFAGNFWAATSEYLNSCPKEIGEKYLDPEVWIGQGTGTLCSFYQTNQNLYFNTVPRIKYDKSRELHKFIHRNSSVTVNTPEIDRSFPDKIYIYFHLYTAGRWKFVVEKIFAAIEKYCPMVDRIYIYVCGPAIDQARKLFSSRYQTLHKKLFWITGREKDSERSCLQKLREHSKFSDFRVLYLHCKGASKIDNWDYVQSWVDLLLYVCVENAKICLNKLRSYDAVGALLKVPGARPRENKSTLNRNDAGWHFSGNFWWANSTYIRCLPQTIGPGYIDPEMWIGFPHRLIGSPTPKLASLYQSDINYYRNLYHQTKIVQKVEFEVIS